MTQLQITCNLLDRESLTFSASLRFTGLAKYFERMHDPNPCSGRNEGILLGGDKNPISRINSSYFLRDIFLRVVSGSVCLPGRAGVTSHVIVDRERGQ